MGAREPGLSAGETADILGVDAAWVTARIDGGELRATHHRGSHPSRPMPERHRISGRDLQVFLMGHAHGLDGSHVDLLRFIMIMAVRNPGRRKSPHRRQGPAGADPGPASYRRWTGGERDRLRSLVETRTPHQAADRGMYGLNWSESLESAGESGILVAMTKPDAGGLPCAFPGNATRCSRSLKRIYRTSLSPS